MNIQQYQNNHISYHEAMKMKYSVAWDKDEKGTKWYNGFASLVGFEKLLEKIPKITNRVFYEIIGNTCKAYFDFDKMAATRSEIDACMIQLVIFFNKIFNQSITQDDLLIYYRYDSECPLVIKSIHVSVMNCCYKKIELKMAVYYFKLVMPHPLFEYLDDAVYTNNRVFSLPGNTKMKYLKQDNQNPKYLVDYKPQSKKPVDYLISHTDMVPKFEIPASNKGIVQMTKVCDKMATRSLKSAFQKLRANGNTNSIDRTIITVDNPVDLFPYLMDNLQPSFYKSPDWRMLTILLKKFDLSAQDFTTWNLNSIKGTPYSHEQNLVFWNRIDTPQVRSGRGVFKKIVEKHLPITLQYSSDNLLADWIYKTLKKCSNGSSPNLDDIVAALNNQKKEKNVSISDAVMYRPGTGDLITTSNVTQPITFALGNYFVEVGYKTIANKQLLQNVVTLKSMDEIVPYVDAFNHSRDKSVLCVKAKWGSGKTHHVCRRIIDYANANKCRIVYFTENNSLNKQVCKQFSTPNAPFVSHIKTSGQSMNQCLLKMDNIDEERSTPTIQHIVCSLESSRKVKILATDIIILDEYESIQLHFESDTFKNQNCELFEIYYAALKAVNKIVVLDADISNDRVNLMSNMLGVKIAPIHVTTNPFSDFQFHFMTSDNLLISAKNALFQHKRVAYASSSKNHLIGVYNSLRAQFPQKIFMLLNGDGVKISINDDLGASEQPMEIDKHDLLENLESKLGEFEVDGFLYSPTIKTGVSINKPYFHQTFAFGHMNSVCAREFAQMLFRARDLIDKTISIALSSNISKPQPFVKPQNIFNYIVTPVQLFHSTQLFGSIANVYKAEYNESGNDFGDLNLNVSYNAHYLRTKMTNLTETYNSTTRFSQDFLIRMVYNHSLPIQFVSEVVPAFDDAVDDLDEPENMDAAEFVATPLMTMEYFENNKSSDEITWQMNSKYGFFYNCYFIRGITDQVIYDQNVYDSINNEAFYLKYNILAMKNKYYNVKSVMGTSLAQMLERAWTFITPQINHVTINKFNDMERNHGLEVMLSKLVTALDIDMHSLPITLTNAQLESKLKNFNGFQHELQSYCDNFMIEHNYKLGDTTTKDYMKHAKAIIKVLLGNLNIELRYVDRTNTTGKNDKMMIRFDGFVAPTSRVSNYQGRLSSTDTRVDASEVKLRKNTKSSYTHIPTGVNVFATPNPQYFVTYKVSLSKQLKKLASTVESANEKIQLNFVKVLGDIQTPYTKKPVIKTRAEFEQIKLDRRIAYEATGDALP